MQRRTTATNVDEYLNDLPRESCVALEKLRKTIRAAAPDATEVISYQMPAYKHYGMLVVFAAFTEHCSFFVMSPSVMEEHKKELAGYDTSKGTIRFQTDKPLPAALVKRLVKARIAENEKLRKK